MKQSPARDALRRIEDIIAQASGRTLDGQARRQVGQVLERLGGGPAAGDVQDSFAQRDATILLADLRGFTAITASHPASVVLELLNRCFVAMKG